MNPVFSFKSENSSPYFSYILLNAVVKLVDAIDGITLYNDQTKSFSCWTDRDCVFKPGDNKVKGTGMIQFLKRRFTFRQLNKWWLGYVMLKTNTFSSGRIISD